MTPRVETLGAYSARPTKITVTVISISVSTSIAFHTRPRILGYGKEKTKEAPQETARQASTCHPAITGYKRGCFRYRAHPHRQKIRRQARQQRDSAQPNENGPASL